MFKNDFILCTIGTFSYMRIFSQGRKRVCSQVSKRSGM